MLSVSRLSLAYFVVAIVGEEMIWIRKVVQAQQCFLRVFIKWSQAIKIRELKRVCAEPNVFKRWNHCESIKYRFLRLSRANLLFAIRNACMQGNRRVGRDGKFKYMQRNECCVIKSIFANVMLSRRQLLLSAVELCFSFRWKSSRWTEGDQRFLRTLPE